MSEQPKSGEWYQDAVGTRVIVVGMASKSRAVVEHECGTIGFMGDWSGWRHLPGCTGWNWHEPQPETFPQLFSHNLSDRMAGGVAYIARLSATEYSCVTFDGDEERYSWNSKLDEWVKSGKWTRITQEEAAAKLREESCEPDPDVNLLAALVNLRDNMDRLNKRVEKLEQAAIPYQTIGGSLR